MWISNHWVYKSYCVIWQSTDLKKIPHLSFFWECSKQHQLLWHHQRIPCLSTVREKGCSSQCRGRSGGSVQARTQSQTHARTMYVLKALTHMHAHLHVFSVRVCVQICFHLYKGCCCCSDNLIGRRGTIPLMLLASLVPCFSERNFIW